MWSPYIRDGNGIAAPQECCKAFAVKMIERKQDIRPAHISSGNILTLQLGCQFIIIVDAVIADDMQMSKPSLALCWDIFPAHLIGV